MKNKLLGIGVLSLMIGAMVMPLATSAYRGDSSVQGPNFSPERHEAMKAAFEGNNYEAWKGLMSGRGRVTQVVNQENFTKFAEAHKLMLEGKTAEAQKIRQDLGLHNGQGLKNGTGRVNR